MIIWKERVVESNHVEHFRCNDRKVGCGHRKPDRATQRFQLDPFPHIAAQTSCRDEELTDAKIGITPPTALKELWAILKAKMVVSRAVQHPSELEEIRPLVMIVIISPAACRGAIQDSKHRVGRTGRTLLWDQVPTHSDLEPRDCLEATFDDVQLSS